MYYPGPLETLSGLLVFGLGPIGIGVAITYPCVGAVIVRNGPVSPKDRFRRFGWLSIPWLMSFPAGLYLSSIYPTKLATIAALIAFLATPGATLLAGAVAVAALKSHRVDAIAVAIGNLVIALLCTISQLAVYGLTRGA